MPRERIESLMGLLDKARTEEEKGQLLEQLVEKERKMQEAVNGKHAALFENVLATLEHKTKEHYRFLRKIDSLRQASIETRLTLSVNDARGVVSCLIMSDLKEPPFADRELGFILISKDIVEAKPVYKFLRRFVIIDTDKLVHCLPEIIEHNPPEKRSWVRESLWSNGPSIPVFSFPDYEETVVKNLQALIKDIPSWTPVK